MTHTAFTRLARRLPQPGASDRELLARVAADRDDGEAFAALVGRHGRAVLAACRHVLADPADVDDAFQATFLLLFRRAGRVKWGDSAGGWLYAAAHRIAVRARADRHRRTARESAARKPERTDAPDPSWREAVAVLHAELDKLPDRHRLPLLLCYLDGRSRDEAAGLLGWSAGAVKGCLERGRKLLADRLRRRGIDLSAGLFGVLAAAAAAGGPPDTLIEQTLAATTGGATPAVAALAKGVTPMKLLPKAVGLALVAAAALAATAVGLPRPPAAAPPPPPAAKPEVAEPTDDELAEVESAVAGRVVGPDERPVAGAAVYWVEYARPPGKPEPRARTAADGSFRFPVQHRAVDYNGKQGVPWSFGYVVVTAAGHGVGWYDRHSPAGDPVVRLPADDRPVRGKVVDGQGKGVAGVTVRCRTVCRPPGGKDLTEWLATARKGGDPLYLDQLNYYWAETPVDHLLPRAVTGPDGAFELPGVGRERLTLLLLTGPGITAREAVVYTRPGEPIPLRRAILPTSPNAPVEANYGLPATIPVTPAPPVVGTVTAADTGEPMPGVLVRSLVPSGGVLTGFLLQARTGRDGTYRLDGLPPAANADIEFVHPDRPYHTGVVAVPAGRKDDTGPFDVALRRGVWVNVKVREKGTGRPVEVEHRYTVFNDNPHVVGAQGGIPRIGWMSSDGVGSDFRVVAFPGPGMLAVKAPGGGPYLRGVGGDGFPKYRQGEQILGGWPIGNLFVREWNTIVPLSPLGDKPVDVTIELDPGLTAAVNVLGPDGKPLAGAEAVGLRPNPWADWREARPGATRVTVRALEADEERRVIVAHGAKKLIGSVVVRAADRGPTTVTLRPWAAVTGRVVDAAGRPVKGADVLPTGDHRVYGLPNGHRFSTDAAGRFTVPGLVSGLEYGLSAWPSEPAGAQPVSVPPFAAPPPGETKDLGDVRVSP